MVLGTVFGNHLQKGWLNARGSGRMDRSQTITSDVGKQQTFRLFVFPAIPIIINWKGTEPEGQETPFLGLQLRKWAFIAYLLNLHPQQSVHPYP